MRNGSSAGIAGIGDGSCSTRLQRDGGIGSVLETLPVPGCFSFRSKYDSRQQIKGVVGAGVAA